MRIRTTITPSGEAPIFSGSLALNNSKKADELEEFPSPSKKGKAKAPKKAQAFGQTAEKKSPLTYYKSIVENITTHTKTALMASKEGTQNHNN